MELKKNIRRIVVVFSLILMLSSGCSNIDIGTTTENQTEPQMTNQVSGIPAYSGDAYIELNGNIPEFSDITSTTSFETYGELDTLGRCQSAFACIGQDLMPTEERDDISDVKPTGWVQQKYDDIDGQYLYNRCHLIGFQLTGENANERNLITGTRYMNTNMIPFENMVADFIRETNYHVLYRVTPVFSGSNLLADGVKIEAQSVEDQGDGIMFNVFVYNVQPGITIDYATGESKRADTAADQGDNSSDTKTGVIRGNSRSKIYHCPGQQAYDDMSDSKYLVEFNSEEAAQSAGYRKAKN